MLGLLLPITALKCKGWIFYVKSYVFTFYFLLSAEAQAEDLINVAICDDCSSATDYSNLAKTMGQGTAIIVNLNTSQANAYNVFPSQHTPGTYGAAKITLPAYVMDAIHGHNELKAAFESHAVAIGGFSLKKQVLNSDDLIFSSSSTANGCGTPSDWSYQVIPDFPYREACDKHDICYTTDRSKASCDGEFIWNMDNIREELADDITTIQWLSNPVGVALFNNLMMKQANIYYWAVVNSEEAKTAYCNSTSAANPPECRPSSSGGGGGSYVGTTTSDVGGGGGTLTQTCELWSFPDGNGGRYFIQRNCSFN